MDLEKLTETAIPNQNQLRVPRKIEDVAHQALENEKINWYYIYRMKEWLWLGVEK